MESQQLIKIVVECDPIPAARPRFNGRKCYQPARDKDYRERVSWAAKLAMKGAEPLKGEICAEIKLYRKYKRTARRFGDVDNHLKAIFDALSGIVIADDAQIIRCVVSKHTDKERPRAEIEIFSAQGV